MFESGSKVVVLGTHTSIHVGVVESHTIEGVHLDQCSWIRETGFEVGDLARKSFTEDPKWESQFYEDPKWESQFYGDTFLPLNTTCSIFKMGDEVELPTENITPKR